MNNTFLWFGVLIFVAMFLLAQGLVLPAFGESARTRRRLRKRLAEIESQASVTGLSLLRQKYLEDLTPFARRIEQWPLMQVLRRFVEQAGLDRPAHRIVLESALFGVVALIVTGMLDLDLRLVAAATVAAIGAPYLRLWWQRSRRIEAIEEQLPDAIDVIKRALRAGHPFVAAVKLVGEDMEGAVANEFAITAADLSFGNDPRGALLGLLSRVPSVPLMGFVTAVLIQRETGGNLAEVLEHISQVIRGRYRFQRKVRTLSAEGRMSAWVLTLVPFALAGILQLTSPKYMTVLFEDPRGIRVLVVCGSLMIVGVLWMRRIIRVDV